MKKHLHNYHIGKIIDTFNPKKLHIFLALVAIISTITIIKVFAIPGTNDQWGYGIETNNKLYTRIRSGGTTRIGSTLLPITDNQIAVHNGSYTLNGSSGYTGQDGNKYNIFIPAKTEIERDRFVAMSGNLGIHIITH